MNVNEENKTILMEKIMTKDTHTKLNVRTYFEKEYQWNTKFKKINNI